MNRPLCVVFGSVGSAADVPDDKANACGFESRRDIAAAIVRHDPFDDDSHRLIWRNAVGRFSNRQNMGLLERNPVRFAPNMVATAQ